MSSYHVALFFLIAAVFALSAWLAIWARRQTRARHAGMVVLLAGLAILGGVAVESLGEPKPIWAAWRMSGRSHVLAVKLIQDFGIFLYVDPGPGAPRSYVLPWNNETASKLQGLMDEARKKGEQGFMMKFEWSWERRKPLQFMPLPQPVVPIPKQAPPPVPRFGA